MGGKSSSATVGYWYHVAFHAGLGVGPIDALLEIRGGDKTAWTGNLTQSGTITISQPNLFGGEKDQGGIVGDVDVMFGEATQQPNAYLTATFGTQQPAWRGMSTLVFKGGKYGAMNPYPQRPSYKVRAIKMGWDGDPGDGSACWYPEKAAIGSDGTADGQMVVTDFTFGFTTSDAGSYQIINGAIANTTKDVQAYVTYYRTPLTLKGVTSLTCWFQLLSLDGGDPIGISIADSAGDTLIDFNPRAEDLIDATQRPWVSYRYANAQPAAPAALVTGHSYQFTATANGAANTWDWSLRDGAAVLGSGSIPQNGLAPAFLQFYRTGNQHTASIAAFARVEIAGPINANAMNPAHILYFARTQADMGRTPTALMHDASFRAGADWYAAQSFGLCTAYDPSAESVDDLIARIEKVAGCSVNRSPVDGLWYLDIANGVYDFASLPILTDDDILDFQDQPKPLDTAVNSLSVTYFDPQQKQSVTPGPVQAMALVDANGVIADTVDYPEIPTASLALRVIQRDLRGFVTPSRTFSLTTTRKPYGWRPNTYFRLQSVKRGIADMVCLLAEKSTGTLKSGAIKITASQDVYSLPSASFVQGETGVDTRPPSVPVPIVTQTVFEAPYIDVVTSLSRADLAALPGDAGYLIAAAADPAVSQDFTLMTSAAGAAFATAATGLFCPAAKIVEGDDLQHGLQTTFTLTDGVQLAAVAVGSAGWWDGELVRVDAIDATALTLTLGRGCADTPPRSHAANAVILFYGIAHASDPTEYTAGESVDARLLTNTGTQQLPLGLANVLPAIQFAGRQAAPYPPAGLTIDGAAYPGVLVSANPVTVVWTERNRVVQADQLVDTGMATIAPEAGTTYTMRTYFNGALIGTTAGITATTATVTPSGDTLVHIEIDAVRNGIASLFPLAATFDYRQALAITTVSPINRTSGTAGTVQMQFAGGVPPVAWSVDTLPAGMTMDQNGLITDAGTALQGDTVSTFTVTDAAATSVSKAITVSVAAAIPWTTYVDSLTPVAHWRMGDAVGSTSLVDRIAAATAALSGTAGTSYKLAQPGMLTGDADGAVLFSGGYAATTAAAKWSLGTGDFSMFLIAKWTNTTFWTTGGVRDGTATNILALFTINRDFDGSGHVGVESWNFNTQKLIATDKVYSDGKPHALGVTYEAATNTMRLYVDGALKVTQVQSGTYSRPTATTMSVRIANNFGSQAFPGTLDEQILFDHKLTDADMATLASYVAKS